MKYVRTKDSVYKVVLVSPLGFVRIDKRDGTYPDVFEKDIIKQTDTIEELIDCYVRVCQPSTDNEWHNILSNKNDQYLIKNKHIDYGAIWTDKGLIYVAKMNDKGELELL